MLLVAACGGGGLPVTPFDKPALDDSLRPDGPPGYVALYDETIAIYNRLPSVVVTDLPDSGSASFTGTALVIPTVTAGGYVGDFAASVNFQSQIFDGVANGFFYDPNENELVAGTGVSVPGLIEVEEVIFDTGSITVTAFGLLDGDIVDNGLGNVVLLGRNAEGLLGAIEMDFGAEDASMLLLADR